MDGAPLGKIARKRPPLAAALEQIQHRTEYFVQFHSPRTGLFARALQQWPDDFELFATQNLFIISGNGGKPAPAISGIGNIRTNSPSFRTCSDRCRGNQRGSIKDNEQVLAIAGKKNRATIFRFALIYPNLEVRSALTSNIVEAWVGNPHKAEESRFALYDALETNDFTRIQEIFFSLYASIPNDWFRKNDIERFESYYASVFYASFAALGLDIVPEDVSNEGKLDMAVKFNGQVYLFGFKMVEDEAEGRALQQIREKQYADKYRSLNRHRHLIGVEFSKKERNVVRFEVENLVDSYGSNH
jgi:hypothetical protein